MTTKRLTKQQKADLEASSAIAQAGHYQAVAGSINNAPIFVREDETIDDATRSILFTVAAGETASITGDLKRGFLRDSRGRDHRHDTVVSMVDAGLLVPVHRPTIPSSLYHLALTDKGRDLLK